MSSRLCPECGGDCSGHTGPYCHHCGHELQPAPPLKPIKLDYTRAELIAICEDAIRPEDVWSNRDSEMSQRKLGEVWALLRAGCGFRILSEEGPRGLNTDRKTIWIEIESKGFNYFEMSELNIGHFYLPTPERLAERGDKDWY